MIEIKKLNIKSIEHEREIITDLDLVINEKDKLAIIGEEGNGKSTLLKCIYNENLIKDYTTVSGEIIKNNLRIGYLEQFLDKEWNTQTVDEYFIKNTPSSEIDYEKYSESYKLNEIFKQLNINYKNLENKVIGNLSGGEKVKIQIAKILFNYPDILLLDEPTNDIDIETLEWLENFISNSTIPVIFISHDEILLERASNGILHLEQINNKTKAKHTIEHIGYKEYIEKRKYLIDRQYKISRNEKREQEKQLNKLNDIYNSVRYNLEGCGSNNPVAGRLLKKKMKNIKSMKNRMLDKELTKAPDIEEKIYIKGNNDNGIHNSKIILDYHLDELKVGENTLKKDINIEVVGKEKVCIVGKNGSGKTTCLKNIYNILKERRDIKVGYMPQNYDEILNSNIKCVDFLKVDNSKQEETQIRTYLASMKFTNDEVNSLVGNLSGGQKAKLFIVKLILSKSNVLILDEPTRNLSPLSNPVIRQLLKEFNGTIISVSHDRKYISEVCTKIINF